MPGPEVTYQREDALNPEEFVGVLKRSTLAERRPVDDIERIKLMCQNANLFVTARVGGNW